MKRLVVEENFLSPAAKWLKCVLVVYKFNFCNECFTPFSDEKADRQDLSEYESINEDNKIEPYLRITIDQKVNTWLSLKIVMYRCISGK